MHHFFSLENGMIDPVDPSHLILSSILYTCISCTIVFALQTSYEILDFLYFLYISLIQITCTK